MVVKGRGKFPARKLPDLESPTPNIKKIASLNKHQASDKALELLHEVATLVSPIMHFYKFKVDLLCEMYPKDSRLLGLNVNRGQKICLRLRSAQDRKWFLERDEIVGTMLHELTHNWHGPHDARFYKTLDELKDKYFEFQVDRSLETSSYRNNFSSKPVHVRLGSQNEQQVKYTTRVGKVGSNVGKGGNLLRNMSLRELAFQAANRRLQDSKKCINTEKEKLEEIPDDSELKLIEIISLDSDDDDDDKLASPKTSKDLGSTLGSKTVNSKKPEKDRKDIEIICLD